MKWHTKGNARVIALLTSLAVAGVVYGFGEYTNAARLKTTADKTNWHVVLQATGALSSWDDVSEFEGDRSGGLVVGTPEAPVTAKLRDVARESFAAHGTTAWAQRSQGYSATRRDPNRKRNDGLCFDVLDGQSCLTIDDTDGDWHAFSSGAGYELTQETPDPGVFYDDGGRGAAEGFKQVQAARLAIIAAAAGWKSNGGNSDSYTACLHADNNGKHNGRKCNRAGNATADQFCKLAERIQDRISNTTAETAALNAYSAWFTRNGQTQTAYNALGTDSSKAYHCNCQRSTSDQDICKPCAGSGRYILSSNSCDLNNPPGPTENPGPTEDPGPTEPTEFLIQSRLHSQK